MNNRYLFRGKRKYTGEWISGDLSMVNEPDIYVFPKDGMDSPDNYEVIPETVGQFTGLKDKNGKDIFEGDIVKSDTYEIEKAEVKWSYSSWEPFEHYMSLIEEDFEIVGNIHDKTQTKL